MRIGIDLLWVRVGRCGGTESYIRNLLTGFAELDKENEYILFTARDNANSFLRYCEENSNIHIVRCETDSESRIKRIFWENLFLDSKAEKYGVDVMFIPVYSMPRVGRKGKIPYAVTIHDLQGLHYKEYFSTIRLLFLKRKWKYSVCHAAQIIATTNYTAEDITNHYPEAEGKTSVIYIPVSVNREPKSDILKRLNIEPKEYYYCVSSLLPHKNLSTVLKTMALRVKESHTHDRIVISGVGGSVSDNVGLADLIDELKIADNVIFTGFVSGEDRDELYKNCKAFLFPSVFEGFGMPPVEGQMMGIPVITTEKTCLKEVTGGHAIYVSDPFDPKEWSVKMDEAIQSTADYTGVDFSEFSEDRIAGKYIELFDRIRG